MNGLNQLVLVDGESTAVITAKGVQLPGKDFIAWQSLFSLLQRFTSHSAFEDAYKAEAERS